MLRVISWALVGVLSLVVGCAQADHRPVSTSQGSGMTLGQGDTGDTSDDDSPTTTVPTTGISASATNGDTDAETAETAETVTDTQASADDTSTDTTTGEDSTGDDTSETNPITASDTDGTTGDETTRGVTTDGDPTDTNGGCNHPPGLYGDCLNGGFLSCNNNQAVCIHDDVNNPSIGVCSLLDCEDACDCPVAPATGNAQVACSAVLSGGQKACVLACGQQTTCPNGMTCWQNTFCVFQ